MKHILLSIAALLPTTPIADPIFPNSVASNDIDFITPEDPSVFHCLQFLERSRQEIPSRLREDLFADDVFTYDTRFQTVKT